MRALLYSIDTYIRPRDWFHFVHKTLDDRRPEHLHTHDCHEIFFVESGCAWHSVNGIEQLLTEGALTFIRPEDNHAIAADTGSCAIMNLMFRSEIASHLADRYDALAGRFFWAGADMPASYALNTHQRQRVWEGAQALRSAHRGLERIETFLLTLMSQIIDLPDHGASDPPQWLLNACREAREPEIFRAGASGLVSAAGRGHEHVCRAMRRHFGVTPTAYVNRIRMEQAALMLTQSDMPIEDVAFATGIENLSHFYRVFRQHHGVPPSAYRKRNVGLVAV